MIPNTLNIFRRLYDYLPPMVPTDVQADMKDALEQLENNPHLTIEELEDTMIAFGKKIWPYRKAFHEIANTYEGKMGERVLLNHLSKPMQKTYGEFIAHGGAYRDFVAGGAALEFFTADERIALSQSLVDLQQYIYKHARQAAMTTDKKIYIKKIEEFRNVQDEIESVFEHLHAIADAEQEHPELATEIREHVRGFEYGLAALDPSPSLDQVTDAIDYFAGRKEYKTARFVRAV